MTDLGMTSFQWPDGLLKEACDLLDRYEVPRKTIEVLELMTDFLNGHGEKRASTAWIYADLLATFEQPRTPEIAATQVAYARCLRYITGTPEAGWLERARADVAQAHIDQRY